MITLIHGNDQLASFAAFKNFLDTSDVLSQTRLVGAELDLKTVKEALETPSFTGPRLAVIEDLSRNRSSNFFKEFKIYLSEVSNEVNLVIYERKLLPPESPVLGLTKNIKSFTVPGGFNVFEWADLVGKRDLKGSLLGWEKLTLSGEEPDYLFLMLVRQFRLLLLLKKGAHLKVPEFVEAKLRGQLKRWGEGDLETSFRRLLSIDRENKTGVAPLEVTVPTFLISTGKVG